MSLRAIYTFLAFKCFSLNEDDISIANFVEIKLLTRAEMIKKMASLFVAFCMSFCESGMLYIFLLSHYFSLHGFLSVL